MIQWHVPTVHKSLSFYLSRMMEHVLVIPVGCMRDSMTTSTSKFVTSFDVIVVVGACLFGVICGIVGLRYTQEMNDKLREVHLFPCSRQIR